MSKLLREYIHTVLMEGSGQALSDEKIEGALDIISGLVSGSTMFRNKAFIAGGAVRDEIMGKTSHDIDIVVALPDGGIKLAEWLYSRLRLEHRPVTFPKFGTAMLSLDGVTHNGIDLSGIEIEMVQTRAEKYDPNSRKPVTSYGTLEQDVARRDLTINSLLKNLTTGEILDLTGKGLQDIKDGVIRTPMDPNETFDDDPLRILRAVRFTSRYDYAMTEDIQEAIAKNAERLKIISKERVKDELGKILTGDNSRVGIELLVDLGLLQYVVPQLVGKEQEVKTLKFTDNLISSMAILLSLTNNQAMSSAKMLRFSNDDSKQIVALANFRNQMINDDSNKNVLKSSQPVFSSGAGDLLEDVLYDQPVRKKLSSLGEYLGSGPNIFFTGGDLLKSFDLKPGPEIGKLVSLQQDLWYNNPAITKQEVRKEIENYLT